LLISAMFLILRLQVFQSLFSQLIQRNIIVLPLFPYHSIVLCLLILILFSFISCIAACVLLEFKWNDWKNNFLFTDSFISISVIVKWELTSWRPSREAASCAATRQLPAFYGTRKFITLFTRALHWFISWERSIQSILHSTPTHWFTTNNLRVFLFSPPPLRAACHAHLILLEFILIILGKE
jgi:hypothetical protein